VFFQVRNQFPSGMPDRLLEAGLRLKGRIGFKESIIDRLLIGIKDYLEDAKAVFHRLE